MGIYIVDADVGSVVSSRGASDVEEIARKMNVEVLACFYPFLNEETFGQA